MLRVSNSISYLEQFPQPSFPSMKQGPRGKWLKDTMSYKQELKVDNHNSKKIQQTISGSSKAQKIDIAKVVNHEHKQSCTMFHLYIIPKKEENTDYTNTHT